MRSPAFQKHPLALALQIGLSLVPFIAGANQLIVSNSTQTASGTYETTADGREGTALIAEDEGNILQKPTATAPVNVTTLGTEAHGAYVQTGGNILLTNANVNTSGKGSHGLFVDKAGSINLLGGSITSGGVDAHAVKVATVSGSDNGNASLEDVEVVSRQGGVMLAEGAKSRISATNTRARVEAASSSAAVVARKGGAITLDGGTLDSAAAAPLLQAEGAGSTIVAKALQAKATHVNASGIEALGGGVVDLQAGTSIDSAGPGAIAQGAGSRISATDSKITAGLGAAVEALAGASVDLVNGEATGNAAGVHAADKGVLQVSGTVVTATAKAEPKHPMVGAWAESGGKIVLKDGARISGDNGLMASGGNIEADGVTIEATGVPSGPGEPQRGAGVFATAGGVVALAGSTVKSAGEGIRFGTYAAKAGADAATAGMPAQVSVKGGSITAAGGPAVHLRAAGAEGIKGVLDLREGAVLTGAGNRLAEVFAEGDGPAELRIQADQVALQGNLKAGPKAILDLSLANQSSLSGAISNGGAVAIDASSRWDVGANSDVGTLRHGGAIAFAGPEQGGFKTLTVHGDHVGEGGTLAMNTVLGDDASASDRLIVEGNTSGQTRLSVRNAGGAGAQTVNGIALVQVAGKSEGEFALDGRAVAGAYEYSLFKGGVATPNDGD